MRVGITFDLQEDYLQEGFSDEETAEFDRPDTIEAIEDALQSLGFETDRIGGVKNLIRRLSIGGRWDMVFNIAEGLRGFAREAQVPAVLEAYDIPYTFSDPMVLALTLHKGMAKRVIRDLGIPTPDFQVVEDREDLDELDLAFPLFAKPVAEGTGKGISAASRIGSREELESVCTGLIRTFKQPVLVESFLPGREFTVGIVGTGREAAALGVVEVLLQSQAEPDVYSYSNKKHYEDRVEYHLVDDPMAKLAVETALAAWRGLGCRDGGRIDLRSDENGRPNFLEVNPLAGLNPVVSDLCILAYKAGITYRELIREIMSSAIRRCSAQGLGYGENKDRHSLQHASLAGAAPLGGIGRRLNTGGGR